jgi:hypothetical protein
MARKREVPEGLLEVRIIARAHAVILVITLAL